MKNQNEDKQTNGVIHLDHGFRFYWMLGAGRGKPEIFGSVSAPSGRTVHGSAGWYRTTDPQVAANVAAALYATPVDVNR